VRRREVVVDACDVGEGVDAATRRLDDAVDVLLLGDVADDRADIGPVERACELVRPRLGDVDRDDPAALSGDPRGGRTADALG
jgi:hypothetical protein